MSSFCPAATKIGDATFSYNVFLTINSRLLLVKKTRLGDAKLCCTSTSASDDTFLPCLGLPWLAGTHDETRCWSCACALQIRIYHMKCMSCAHKAQWRAMRFPLEDFPLVASHSKQGRDQDQDQGADENGKTGQREMCACHDATMTMVGWAAFFFLFVFGAGDCYQRRVV